MSPVVYFQLGKNPELSLAELTSFFPDAIFRFVHAHLVTCEYDLSVSLEQVMEMSGGLVSAGIVSDSRSTDVVSLVEHALLSETRSIAVSLYTIDEVISIKELLDRVKDRKKAQEHSLRYVLPAGQMTEMRSAALFHEMKDKRFQHFVIWKDGDEYRIGHTVVVQDVDEWSKLDYGKPSRRIHEGMLPPKVARVMVNLGLGRVLSSEKTPRVYDPFCGSGTVLIEGLRVGCRVVGSDLSPDAVQSTEENLRWYSQRTRSRMQKHPVFGYPCMENIDWRAFVGDAVHLDTHFPGQEIDLVVTEPYMGPLFTEAPDIDQAKNQQKGLMKLYLGFFKSLRHALKEGGVVVFSLPFYRLNGRVMRIPLIDRLRDIGYNPIIPSIDYFVEHTIVGREIIILRLEN